MAKDTIIIKRHTFLLAFRREKYLAAHSLGEKNLRYPPKIFYIAKLA